ncbi:uncharacterized protein LOC124149185 isoform X3 [Haliotis rufescens]|uniref:uncharacterized protein LOC124149185 isoform X3 n=1 Tax=Haliotis rufescens TaxID=6454 RepID=UPI00201F98A0|nr:uncharacterized protein LOC124149185 isoform X3 [Haliotis rufescens]XP_046376557.2 uncharacterized protein LOC124149185 isoform X3 [Haliotis rufescens]
MEKQYSVEFFASFVEQLQDVCRNYLHFSQFVEVSGYVCVEIDNMKKERYVLSELLQSSGNVVSESYCTKAFKTRGNRSASGNSMGFYETSLSNRIPRSNEQSQINSRSKLLTRQEEVLQTFPSLSDSRSLHNVNAMSTFSSDLVQEQNMVADPVFSRSSSYTAIPLSGNSVASVPPEQTQTRTPTHSIFTGIAPFGRERVGQTSGESHDFVSHSPTSSASRSSFTYDTIQDESEEASVSIPKRLAETISGTFKTEPEAEEVIDLDLFEDDPDESQCSIIDSNQGGGFSENSPSSALVPKNPKKTNPGTLKVMKSSLKQFKGYYYDRYGQDIDPLTTEPEELDQILLDFFQGTRKKNGAEPNPGSLKTMQVFLERYLKEGGYPYSITKDARFKSSRNYIKMKMEDFNKNKVVQKPIPVDENDIEIMFERNVMGDYNSESLLNTVWFLNSKYFGLRGIADHFNLKWGDIKLKVNDQGKEYVERALSTNFCLKVFAKPDNLDRCFVHFFKQYRSMRPKLAMDDGSPFYLKSVRNMSSDRWYLPEPLTWSCYTKLWRKMVSNADLPFRKKIF